MQRFLARGIAEQIKTDKSAVLTTRKRDLLEKNVHHVGHARKGKKTFQERAHSGFCESKYSIYVEYLSVIVTLARNSVQQRMPTRPPGHRVLTRRDRFTL